MWPYWSQFQALCWCFPSQLPFTILARPRIPQNQPAQAHLGSLACHGTREGAQPLTHCAAIITVAAHVEALIVPCLALRDKTTSLRALPGADLGPRQLVPHPTAKHSTRTVGFREIPFWNNVKITFSCIYAKRSFYLHGVSVGLHCPLPFRDHFSLSGKSWASTPSVLMAFVPFVILDCHFSS